MASESIEDVEKVENSNFTADDAEIDKLGHCVQVLRGPLAACMGLLKGALDALPEESKPMVTEWIGNADAALKEVGALLDSP